MLEAVYDFFYAWISFVFLCTGLVSLLTYVVPFVLQTYVFKVQNFREKYNARWAVVTGGSSGIGRAISERLASQGINVVVAALPDSLLDEVIDNLSTKYPDQEFRGVGVDLSSSSFMEELTDRTDDVDVQLVFNNAGFLTLGAFYDVSLGRQMANFEVNAGAAVRVTHHFAGLMVKKGLRGFIGYTSSPAGMFACPFSVIYGSTKAFLTEFGVSIAAELKPQGIDVLVVHPSPVDTAFYNAKDADKSGSLLAFKKTAVPPTVIADCFFSAAGRGAVVRDQGYFSIVVRMMLKVIDYNFLSWIIAVFSRLSGEYKTFVSDKKKTQ